MVQVGKVLKIGGQKIYLGERKRVHLDVASLYDYTHLKLPVEVIRGHKAGGPVLFLSAAIHGDEINGVEIIKRVIKEIDIEQLNGTLIAIPIVNVFGFNNRSRYLPDRRDLNRSFPGSATGSLASRLANIFMKEIVRKCTHGIDLHTGAVHRSNLPQIRACLDDPETKKLAHSFGAPVIIHSAVRDGSLREAARRRKIPMLLFEGGEALRFDENVINAGVHGVRSVMDGIGLLSEEDGQKDDKGKTYEANDSFWVRAPHSGSFTVLRELGDRVQKDEVLAVISDPFGGEEFQVRTPDLGIVIGKTEIPLVNQGDAMFHIATFKNNIRVKRAIDLYDEVIS